MPSPSRFRRPDRGWHRGRFPLVSPPQLDPSSVQVPPRIWGVWKWRLKGASEHLQADVFIVPAGLLVVGRCTKCGGRVERLVEFDDSNQPGFGGVSPDGPPARAASASRERGLLGTALRQVLGVLDEGHSSCNSSPGTHRVAPLTKQFLRKALTDATRDIESDERTAGKLYLLMDDGRGCAVDTEHLIRGAPAPSAERTANRAAGVEAVRRYLRALELTPSTVVLIGEAWATSLEGYEMRCPGEGEREEIALVALVTCRFGCLQWANSAAELRSPDISRGRVKLRNWRPIVDPAPLVDGIFRSPVSEP